MNEIKRTLGNQLVSIVIIMFVVIIATLGFFLPRVLLPIYEENLYQYLKQPLEIIGSESDYETINTNVAYLYIVNTGDIVSSANLGTIISATNEQILDNIKEPHGKFRFKGETYYYKTISENHVVKIALTNSDYINNIRKEILRTIFPLLIISFLICLGLLIVWSRNIVMKIEHLKVKIDNLDNDQFVDDYNYGFEDELKSLSTSIDDMKTTLRQHEEYKNQMYQNISHDLKTPLSVINSYIEAIEDNVEPVDTGFRIIKEQVEKLKIKVHSLLYLNKLTHLKDLKDFELENINVAGIIKSSINKFKLSRPDIKWELNVGDNKVNFKGSPDMWEALVDNLLDNFTRYAETCITVTIKNNRITFYNDGPNIDPTILSDIFTPYKKGIKGQFGLGLSIVKKTIALFGYEINVKNEKKGVSFIIK